MLELMDLQLFANNGEDVDVDVDDNVNDTKDVNVSDDVDGKVDDKVDDKISLKDILAEDDELYKQFQSTIDSRVSQALKTREQKHKEELEQQKRRAQMTEEELIAEREKELQSREQKLKEYELQLKKVEYCKDNDIPLDLVEFINVQNEEEIEEKATVLTTLIDKLVEEKVKKQLSVNGLDIDDKSGSEPVLSIDDMEGLSMDEINAHFDRLLK